MVMLMLSEARNFIRQERRILSIIKIKMKNFLMICRIGEENFSTTTCLERNRYFFMMLISMGFSIFTRRKAKGKKILRELRIQNRAKHNSASTHLKNINFLSTPAFILTLLAVTRRGKTKQFDRFFSYHSWIFF